MNENKEKRFFGLKAIIYTIFIPEKLLSMVVFIHSSTPSDKNIIKVKIYRKTQQSFMIQRV